MQIMQNENKSLHHRQNKCTFQTKHAVHIMKNKILRNLSSWLKFVDEMSGEPVVY